MKKIFFGLGKISLFVFLTTMLGCTSILYRSRGKIPTSFDYNPAHPREIVIKGEKKFYLWGLIPNTHYVYIDEVIDRAGFEEVSKIEIQEEREAKNMLISILTFGLYIPKSYTINANTNEI